MMKDLDQEMMEIVLVWQLEEVVKQNCAGDSDYKVRGSAILHISVGSEPQDHHIGGPCWVIELLAPVGVQGTCGCGKHVAQGIFQKFYTKCASVWTCFFYTADQSSLITEADLFLESYHGSVFREKHG